MIEEKRLQRAKGPVALDHHAKKRKADKAARHARRVTRKTAK